MWFVALTALLFTTADGATTGRTTSSSSAGTTLAPAGVPRLPTPPPVSILGASAYSIVVRWSGTSNLGGEQTAAAMNATLQMNGIYSPFVSIYSVTATAFEYTATGLSPATVYGFRVYTSMEGFVGAYSSTLYAFTTNGPVTTALISTGAAGSDALLSTSVAVSASTEFGTSNAETASLGTSGDPSAVPPAPTTSVVVLGSANLDGSDSAPSAVAEAGQLPIIIGAACGGLCCLLAVALAAIALRRRRRSHPATAEDMAILLADQLSDEQIFRELLGPSVTVKSSTASTSSLASPESLTPSTSQSETAAAVTLQSAWRRHRQVPALPTGLPMALPPAEARPPSACGDLEAPPLDTRDDRNLPLDEAPTRLDGPGVAAPILQPEPAESAEAAPVPAAPLSRHAAADRIQRAFRRRQKRKAPAQSSPAPTPPTTTSSLTTSASAQRRLAPWRLTPLEPLTPLASHAPLAPLAPLATGKSNSIAMPAFAKAKPLPGVRPASGQRNSS